MNYHKFTPEKRNVSKPTSEQMQKLAARNDELTMLNALRSGNKNYGVGNWR